MKIAVSIEGIFFLTRFAFHHSGVGGSYVLFSFFLLQNLPSAQYNGVYLSPKAVWTLFSEIKNGEVAFLKKQLPPFPPFQSFSSVTFGRIPLQGMFSVRNVAVSGLDSLA